MLSRKISIHVLREEDDVLLGAYRLKKKDFNPRPPRGGRPNGIQEPDAEDMISIHVLREEDDLC